MILWDKKIFFLLCFSFYQVLANEINLTCYSTNCTKFGNALQQFQKTKSTDKADKAREMCRYYFDLTLDELKSFEIKINDFDTDDFAKICIDIIL